ncbi:uncharacterized protein LOC142176622 [Nicotiana tabacum]|uniref:Uncharacterized protein LOC142176622 n=1 Tax=Nicotiana tabacum TaxID=4097 RepID=A0AC58TU72_TOBAC
MAVKLVVGGLTLSVISACAPQEGLSEAVKRQFGEDLDEVVHGILCTEKILLKGILMAISRLMLGVTMMCMEGSDLEMAGTSLLDFARAFDLVVVNSSPSKREEHLVTFRSIVART